MKKLILIIFLIVVSYIVMWMYMSSAFYKSVNEIKEHSKNMSDIYKSLQSYEENHGQLPDFSEWMDILIDSGLPKEKLIYAEYDTNLSSKVSNFAINKYIEGYKLSEVPKGTVLFFESHIGWNQVGGPEIAKGHVVASAELEYVSILFIGGQIEQRPKEGIDGLRWKP